MQLEDVARGGAWWGVTRRFLPSSTPALPWGSGNPNRFLGKVVPRPPRLCTFLQAITIVLGATALGAVVGGL